MPSIPNPYIVVAKLAGLCLIGMAIFFLFMSWQSRGQEIVRLTEWRNTVTIAATDATVEPDAKGVRKLLAPAQVPAAIAGLKRGFDSAMASINLANTLTLDAKTRADLADRALATANVLFEQRYASAEKRIGALDQRKPQATPTLQCQAAGIDSKAAWEAWK